MERRGHPVRRRANGLLTGAIRGCDGDSGRGVLRVGRRPPARLFEETGKVLWDMDTAREFPTVDGRPAHGGSLDVAGPAVANGMIFVNSGYGQWGGMPGNVLLAFSAR